MSINRIDKMFTKSNEINYLFTGHKLLKMDIPSIFSRLFQNYRNSNLMACRAVKLVVYYLRRKLTL